MAYSKEVVDRFENVLANPEKYSVGRFDPKDPNVATGMTGAPACGDVMKLDLKLDPETDEILDVKFDFKQREFLTAPFLQQSIVRLAEEKEVDASEISSVILTKDSEANKVYILAYHKNEFYKQISFNWLFDNPEEILGDMM